MKARPHKGRAFLMFHMKRMEAAMPKAMEKALKRQATEKGLKGEHKDAYVYGTMRKTGWKPEREKTPAAPKPAKRGLL
jgi:hypothetical protein